MSTGDLIKTYFRVKKFNLKEQLFVIINYYKKISFCLIDLLLLFIYLFINPYHISKKFLKNKNFKNIHLYGETPLSTFEYMVKRAGILPHHTFLELGSGRGRCSFWLSKFVGCSVDSVEWIPFFSKTSLFLSKIFRLKNIVFHHQDMLIFDCLRYDFIFLYGTCLEDREILILIENFKRADHKLKIITISYSLSDYDPNFRTIDQFSLSFPWGEADCFINMRVDYR